MRVLLLGGNGFLGTGLQKELNNRKIDFISIDKDDIDLVDKYSANKLVDILENITHVVILASNIGTSIFNGQDSVILKAAYENAAMLENIKTGIFLANKKYRRKYNVTFYSTSEVYGNQRSIYSTIKSITNYNIVQNKGLRYLYAYIKEKFEKDYKKIMSMYDSPVSCFKVVKPFNVIGENQKRGVLFEMVKSAINSNLIIYNKDTSRTFTNIDYASFEGVNVILRDFSYSMNVADERCSLTLESLAKIVKDVLQLEDCQLVELQPDSYIQYRQVSQVDENIEKSKEVLAPYIKQLYTKMSKQ